MSDEDHDWHVVEYRCRLGRAARSRVMKIGDRVRVCETGMHGTIVGRLDDGDEVVPCNEYELRHIESEKPR